jgi:hypothetical protein
VLVEMKDQGSDMILLMADRNSSIDHGFPSRATRCQPMGASASPPRTPSFPEFRHGILFS